MIGIILILVLVFAAVIGAVSGLVKGYAKTSFWGGTVLLTLLIERIVGSGVKKENSGFAIAVIITAIASLLILTILFATFRKFVNGKMEARRTLSEYENHDALEENETRILCAVDGKDKSAYKKLRKERKKIKIKSGPWGVVNRVTGAVSGFLNGFTGAFVAVAFVVLFVDISQISAIHSVFGDFIESSIWAKTLGAIALDVILISLLSLAIRSGYKSGISSLLSIIVVVGLVVLFGYVSYTLASSEAASGMVSGLESSLLGALPEALSGLKHNLAVIITAAIFFLLSLVVIIIVAIFLPKFVEKFRENKVFGAVDGVFGAIIFTAFIFALLALFGGTAYTLNDLPALAKLNEYMDKSFFADCVYSCNPLNDMLSNLPLRGWFGAAE